MGWKGALRSMAAASRAAQRDSERRYKALLKAQEATTAATAVAELDALIQDLVSLHVHHADHIDWAETAARSEPLPPVRAATNERIAQARLDAFQPRFFDFLQGGSAKRTKNLEDALVAAQAADDREFYEAERQFQSDLEDWKTDRALASRLLVGEPAAIRDVISEMQAFSQEGMIGSQIRFAIKDNAVHAIVSVHSDEIVPKIRRKQLAGGRLSETRMPTGDFNDVYQDYVCSAALRVGSDLLAILPLTEIYVTCTPMMLDTASGHLQETPILSIQIVRQTMDRLRLAAIDPSDALVNFNHAMNFKRTRGFAAIMPLRPID